MFGNLFKWLYLWWLTWALRDLTTTQPLHPDIPSLIGEIDAVQRSIKKLGWLDIAESLFTALLIFLLLAVIFHGAYAGLTSY